jgi:hypothetical protein
MSSKLKRSKSLTAQNIHLTEEEQDILYAWIDGVPINKPKKNIARDFSDCSLLSHVIKHYLAPASKGIIDIHNYVETSNL